MMQSRHRDGKRRSRDGPIISRRGIDIRAVIASNQRRRTVHECVEADFVRVLDDQRQQAEADRLLDYLIENVGTFVTPPTMPIPARTEGTSAHIKDRIPHDEEKESAIIQA